jgi:DNA-binding SARP family transcriptional activator/predicted ATPase
MLEVRLLGQFKVVLDGAVVEIASRPAQSLFAYLILNPGTEHRREKLAGLFWPDSSESNARNNLRQALWRVRKALKEDEGVEEGFLRADSFTLDFNPQATYWLDAEALEGDIPPDKTTEDLIEIISLYEGELLPGFYDDWVVLERERLQASFERKMQGLMECLVGEKRWHEVLEWGERWIALGQVPELAFRALMIAHGGLGDTSSVASVFQRCVEILANELAVEPSEDTKTVYEKLSSGEKFFRLYPFEEAPTAQRMGGFPTIPEPHPPAFLDVELRLRDESAGIFVAREAELERLQGFFREMMGGKGRVVFITGDAGSGKTALMHEFARRAQESIPDLRVSFGDCNALSGIGDPYLPFRDAFGMLCGDLESKYESGQLRREQAQRLWTSLPLSIQSVVKDGPDLVHSFIHGSALLAFGKAYNPEKTGWLQPLEELIQGQAIQLGSTGLEQKDLFNQYTKVLQAFSAQHPLLLLLDDLQWADAGSISLLFHLGRRIEESRILILGAYRPTELSTTAEGEAHPLGKVVSEFKRNFGDIQVDLGTVQNEEGRKFVEGLLDTEPNRLDESFREALYRRTGGHPLFTIELLRAMEGRGDIVQDQEGCWMEATSLDWDRLPARVEGVIEERVGRLDENLQKLLTVASVEGEEFTAEVLAGVLNLEVKEVIKDLSHQLDKQHRLVSAQGVQRMGERRLSIYRFRHTLFEKHLYNQLDPVERTNLHEEIGSLLESFYGTQVDEVAVALARHFDEAGIPDKAVTYYEGAGNRAKRLSADEDAISHFKRGIELLQGLPDSAELAQRELRLQISLGAPLIIARGYGAPEVNETFARARELSIMVLDPPQLFPLVYGLRSFYLMRADHETAREIAEQLIAIADQEGDLSFYLQAHEALGSTLFYLGELSLAKEHLEKGVELFDAQEHQSHAYLYGQDPGVACMSYLGLTSWSLGFFDQALQWAESAIRLAREQNHPFSLALALDFAASLHALLRNAESTKNYAEEAIAISERQHFPMWLAMGKILSGWAQAEQGQLKSGIKTINEGLEAWQSTGATLGRPNFSALLADALGKAGREVEGLKVVAQALEAAQSTEERVNEAELYRLQGELLRTQGAEVDQIENSFQKALEVARHQGAKGAELRVAVSLGKLWVNKNKSVDARALLTDLCNGLTEGADAVDFLEARAILDGIT